MKVDEAVANLEKQLNTPQFDAHAQQGEPVEVFQVEAVRTLLEGYQAKSKKAYWKPNKWEDDGRKYNCGYICSECRTSNGVKTRHCPSCGADMSGPEPGVEG